jgi:hypothetical protein
MGVLAVMACGTKTAKTLNSNWSSATAVSDLYNIIETYSCETAYPRYCIHQASRFLTPDQGYFNDNATNSAEGSAT